MKKYCSNRQGYGDNIGPCMANPPDQSRRAETANDKACEMCSPDYPDLDFGKAQFNRRKRVQRAQSTCAHLH